MLHLEEFDLNPTRISLESGGLHGINLTLRKRASLTVDEVARVDLKLGGFEKILERPKTMPRSKW